VSDRIHLRVPGPTPLPDQVRESGSRQMINHRGPEFSELIGRVTSRLQGAFATQNELHILTASGTGGMEAAVVNHLSPGDRVLAVSIGSFGDRFAAIASRYGAEVQKLDVEWGQAADADEVAAALRRMLTESAPAKAVLLTHNETSTGVTNPLARLAAASREASPDALIIVDAISGLGAVPFETDAWDLDVVVTGSQKSWMVPPGLAMISSSARARGAEQQATMPRYYFDLAEARKYAAKGETPWTPAVSVLFQLDVALDLLEREGYPRIFARHAACAEAARSGLRRLGFRLLADHEHASDTVTAAWVPEGMDWSSFNASLRERGLVLAGGQGKLTGKILRIGHLGAVEPADIETAIDIIEQALRVADLPTGAGAVSAGA